MSKRETENVCNMPEVLNIEVHRSEQTGRYYIEFIDWSGTGRVGSWTTRNITEAIFNVLLKICYPKWNGKGKAPCENATIEWTCIGCNDKNCPVKRKNPELYEELRDRMRLRG